MRDGKVSRVRGKIKQEALVTRTKGVPVLIRVYKAQKHPAKADQQLSSAFLPSKTLFLLST